MANSIPIQNFLTFQVATPQQGLGTPNTGNIAVFTREAYASSFGTAGFKIYYTSGPAGVDFGTGSNTYQMVNEILTVQPNILNSPGYVVVIPFLSTAQDQQVKITFPGVPASGVWAIGYNGAFTSALSATESASALQTALQSVAGLSSATVSGSIAAGFNINSEVSGAGHPFTVYPQFTVTCTSANATIGATYTDSNANIFTVYATIATQTTLLMVGTAIPAASGTLTKVSGTGDATITYSAVAGGLADSNSNTIFPVSVVTVPGAAAETLDQAIIRTQSLVSYFGVMSAEIVESVAQTQAGAAYIQSQNLIGFLVSATSSDLQAGGTLFNIQSLGYTQSRCLYYGGSTTQALVYMAGYASSLLSVNYNGVNTCLTMNLKNIAGVAADPTITNAQYLLAQTCGADVYVNLASFGSAVLPKCITFGANDFSDNQTNLQALAMYLLTAYFNTLAQTTTKIAQTENAMTFLKGNLRAVCRQFVTNGFIAPGTWNAQTPFGNPQLFLQNISQVGFYIYSAPLSQQNPSQRAARINPPISVAVKYAGAQQGGSGLIYINP